MFDIRKVINGNLVVPSLELYIFFGLNYPMLGTEKPYILVLWTVIEGEAGLDRVLLCLVRVGLE